MSGIFAFRALADHPQHPVAAILTEVGDVGCAGLIDTQGIVQQQPSLAMRSSTTATQARPAAT